MGTLTLEERVAALEAEVAKLAKEHNGATTIPTKPWWKEIWGQFKDDPIYEEAMALGRAYRESLRSEGGEESEL